jgi:hypothetical protein
VSLGGKLSYVFVYATTELLQGRYIVILVCYTYFFVYDLIWLFVALVEILGLRMLSFVVYEV